MTSRSASLLLMAFGLLLVVAAGCGGAATTVGSAGSAVSTASVANGQSTALHGPPAGWEGRPPLHVRGFVATTPLGYVPAQIAQAYGFSGTAARETIAIVDAYGSPTITKDLTHFCNQFGLPLDKLTIQNMASTSTTSTGGGGGGTHGKKNGNHAQPSANAGWALETSLDVEWADAIAPGANILLVEAASASLTDLVAAIDYATSNGATVVSMSWSGSEFSGEDTYDTHFENPNISFTAAAGDSGAGAQWPSVSQYVTSVGGTTLTLSANGTIESETGWSGSGGGPSAYIQEPGFQTKFGIAGLSGMRETPDVALDADPNTGVAVYDTTSYHGLTGWFELGGTSVGTPIWAAAIALANATRGSNLGPANDALYGVVTTLTLGNDYNDITSGNNGYTAGPGYDMVTGLGTPKFGALSSALTSY